MAERTVSVRLKAVVDDYKRAMGEAKKSTDDFVRATDNWNRLGRSTAELGDRLTRNVTLPIVALGAVATKMAADFDSAFVQMQTLAGVTGDEVDALKESVLGLAGETGKAPQELAEALYFLQSSGLDSAEAMEALEVSAKASAVGLGDTATVADAVSSIMLAYSESAMSAAEATDILIATARAGKVEPAELASQMGRLLPVASELGITFADVGGAIAALSQGGNSASEATTQLSNVMMKLLRPSQQARESLEEVGLSTDAIRQMIAERGLLGTLEELRAALGDSGFNDFFEDSQAILGSLALVGGDLDQTRELFEQVNDSVGATDEAFGKWAESMGAENARAFADFQVALIRLGDIIAPIAADILGFAAGVAKAFSSLPEWAQNAVVGFLAVAAAAGPVLSVGGRLISMFSSLMQLMANWAVPDTAIRGLGSSSVAASGGVGLLGTAMVGLGIAMPGLAVAGYGVARMMQENAERAARASERVDALTAAMERQTQGAQGAVAEELAMRLATADLGEALRSADADLSVFTEAITSGNDELRDLPQSLDGLSEAGDQIRELADSGSAWAAELVRLAESGELTGEQVADLMFRLSELSENYDSATQATENAEFAQEEMAGTTGATTAEIEAQTQALTELAEQLAAQFDPLFGLLNAENAVRDSLQAETEAIANLQAVRADSTATLADIAAAEQAVTDAQLASTEAAYGLESAQIALLSAVQQGSVSFESAISTLDQWQADGIISAGTADYMRGRINLLRAGLEDTAGRYGVDLAVSGVGSVIGALAGVRAAVNSIDRYVGIEVEFHQTGSGPIRQRQHGGPVEANRAYLVGEVGPELFVSDTPGRVIPHHELASLSVPMASHGSVAGGGDTYMINVDLRGAWLRTPRDVSAAVSHAVSKELRTGRALKSMVRTASQ